MEYDKYRKLIFLFLLEFLNSVIMHNNIFEKIYFEFVKNVLH